ncbi:N-acetylmuramoyl-L-alanine amidase [Streptomyces sp. NPDC051569]|uniref:N-acetylmuramoyl-L-alanine amidase n=1 Tax=Streptomyces sp. NPDC051569 TaxID=3365661 RepID=UPI0037B3105F
MSMPLTATQILAALTAEGLAPIEQAGWRTHDRAGHGSWGPVHGVMIHHTAGTAPSDGQIVWSGRADLPGPCAHAYLAKGGVLTLTSAGRANHAGGGDGAVLAAVVTESYGDRPPAPHAHEGSAAAVDGNVHFYGLEMSNRGDGRDPWPAAQYEAAVRWAAALCRAHRWSAKSVIAHREWSDWKPDPAGIDMAKFRADVQARLDAGKPKPSTPAKPPSMPAFPGRDRFKLGAKNAYAKQLQTWLDKAGWGPKYKVGPSTTMTQLDLDKVTALQRHYLSALGPADGLTGPKTWQYAYETANGLRKK